MSDRKDTSAVQQRLMKTWASEGGPDGALGQLAAQIGQGLKMWTITAVEAEVILAEVVRLAGFHNAYCDEFIGEQQTYDPHFDIEKLLEPLS